MVVFNRTIPSICCVLAFSVLMPVQANASCTGDGEDAPFRCQAQTEITVAGGKTGGLVEVKISDNTYMVLTEQDETVGPPPKRCDYLDQRWHFTLPAGGNWKLVVEGQRNDVGAGVMTSAFLCRLTIRVSHPPAWSLIIPSTIIPSTSSTSQRSSRTVTGH